MQTKLHSPSMWHSNSYNLNFTTTKFLSRSGLCPARQIHRCYPEMQKCISAEMTEERTETFNICLDSTWLVASMVFIILKSWSSISFLLNPGSRIREVGKKQLSIQAFICKSLPPDNAVESIQSKTWQSGLVDPQCNCYCSA